MYLKNFNDFVLCRRMTPGKGIQPVSCMTILYSMITNHLSDIRLQVKRVVSLVIAHGHFIIPQGFV